MNGYEFDYFQGVGPEFQSRVVPFREKMFLELYKDVKAEFDEDYLHDPYDAYSWHVITKDWQGEDVGAIRLTSPEAGLTEPENVSEIWREEFAERRRNDCRPIYASRFFMNLSHRMMGGLWLYYKATELAAEIGGTEIVVLAKKGKLQNFYRGFGAVETSIPQDVIYHEEDNWGPHHMLILPLSHELPESMKAMFDQFPASQ